MQIEGCLLASMVLVNKTLLCQVAVGHTCGTQSFTKSERWGKMCTFNLMLN